MSLYLVCGVCNIAYILPCLHCDKSLLLTLYIGMLACRHRCCSLMDEVTAVQLVMLSDQQQSRQVVRSVPLKAVTTNSGSNLVDSMHGLTLLLLVLGKESQDSLDPTAIAMRHAFCA